MRIMIIILALGIVWAIPARAQIYQDKYENMIVPMERAIDNSQAYTANVESPGAIEDNKPNAQRYEENVGAMDEVTDRHFIVAVDGKIPDQNEPKP